MKAPSISLRSYGIRQTIQQAEKKDSGNALQIKQMPSCHEAPSYIEQGRHYLNAVAQYAPIRRLTYTLSGALIAGGLSALYMYPSIPRDEFPRGDDREQFKNNFLVNSSAVFVAGLVASYLVPYMAHKLDKWAAKDASN